MPCAWLLVLLFASLWGCAASPSPDPAVSGATPKVRVALLPALWTTDATLHPACVRAARLSLGKIGSIETTQVPTPARSSPETPCQEEVSCIREASQQAKATKALVIKLARLGNTVLVRVALIDVLGGTQEQIHQSVVRNATEKNVELEVQRLVTKMAQPFVPARRPVEVEAPSWYERWWVWAGGAAVVAGGVTAAVLLSRDQPSQQQTPPDIIITPP